MRGGRRPLFVYFLVVSAIVLVCAVGGGALATLSAARRFHRQQLFRSLHSLAGMLSAELVAQQAAAGRSLAEDTEEVDRISKRLGKAAGCRLTVVLPDGRVAGDSDHDPAEMDNHGNRPEVAAALQGRSAVAERYSHTRRRWVFYAAVPIEGGGARLGAARAAVTVERFQAEQKALGRGLAGATGGIFVLAVLLSVVVARRLTTPLKEIRSRADAFSLSDADPPQYSKLPGSTIAEVHALTFAFNRMMETLNDRIRLLTRERDEQNALLRSMVEGVLAVDAEKRIRRINPAVEAWLGIRQGQVEGRSILEIVRNLDLLAIVETGLEQEGVLERRIHLPESDRYVLVHATALHGAGGERAGVLLVLHDITRLQRMETMRRDFVANASHELKTPVTAIKAAVETLLEGAKDTPQEAEQFLGMISRQVNRLQAIVDDLLELSRIEYDAETGRVTLVEAPVAPVLQAAVEMCQSLAREKRIAVRLVCPEDLTAPLHAPLLERAVVNLLDNAIKYSGPDTRVTVSAATVESEIVIAVQDEGPGIPASEIPRIFERFYRVDKSRSRELGGTGLGLSIVKQIALAHRGRVDVQSASGKGTIFRIRLPLATRTA